MIDSGHIIEDIIEINRRLCFDIWSIAIASGLPSGLSPRLILPVKRNQKPRLSEQEARFLYCSLVNSLNYYYSVETPTQERYKQKGQDYSTASSDLSLYYFDRTEFLRVANVEFKAHNPGREFIRKDIEKLMGEGLIGNWFHILKNIDRNTLPSLCDKISKSLVECYLPQKHKKISIVFTFCVFDKRWGCTRHFQFDQSIHNLKDLSANFLSPEYHIFRGKIIVSNQRGWRIISKAD